MLKARHGVERHDLPLLIRKLLQTGAQNTSILHRERSGIRERQLPILQTGFRFPLLAQSLEAQVLAMVKIHASGFPREA